MSHPFPAVHSIPKASLIGHDRSSPYGSLNPLPIHIQAFVSQYNATPNQRTVTIKILRVSLGHSILRETDLKKDDILHKVTTELRDWVLALSVIRLLYSIAPQLTGFRVLETIFCLTSSERVWSAWQKGGHRRRILKRDRQTSLWWTADNYLLQKRFHRQALLF